jgi:energy-coupling factor transporter ATP-binding protein EcfA2
VSFSVNRVEIHGLYGRSDLELDLHPDVNILYGRNGSGKTTLLHVVANILGGSLDRFAYLDFDRIFLQLNDGRGISLDRSRESNLPHATTIQVKIDGNPVTRFRADLVKEIDDATSFGFLALGSYRASSRSAGSAEGFAQAKAIQKAAAQLSTERAAYFPAFRTMIEAWRSVKSSTSSTAYTVTMPATYPYEPEEASLTRLARDLFGNFVPEVNYPSVIEIERSLSDQVNSAEFEIATASERIFSNAFVSAFAALPKRTADPVSGGPHIQGAAGEILKTIESLLGELNKSQIEDYPETRQDDIY